MGPTRLSQVVAGCNLEGRWQHQHPTFFFSPQNFFFLPIIANLLIPCIARPSSSSLSFVCYIKYKPQKGSLITFQFQFPQPHFISRTLIPRYVSFSTISLCLQCTFCLCGLGCQTCSWILLYDSSPTLSFSQIMLL